MKRLSGESHFADWIFGARSARERGVRSWDEWRQAKGAQLPTAAEARKKAEEKRKAEDGKASKS